MTRPDPPRPTRPALFGLPSQPSQPDRRGWMHRRRDKIVEEIQRNRRGEYKVPTWVLAVILVAVVAGWLALVLLVGRS